MKMLGVLTGENKMNYNKGQCRMCFDI